MKLSRSCAALASFIALAAPGAHAQDASTYRSVVNAKDFSADWKQFYETADAKTARVRSELPHHRHVAFGSEAKQRLDVYQPQDMPHGAPVFVFLHGGGFWEGDRNHFGYVAGPLAAKGIITVVPSYRLTPDAQHPAQPDDVRAAVAWTYWNISKYGGDPRRIYVGGHSAGAILAAEVSVDPTWTARFSLPADVIRGCALVSAPYDLREEGFVKDYMPTPTQRAAGSPMLHVRAPPGRCVLSAGSKETEYVQYAKQLAERMRAKKTQTRVVVVKGLAHDAMGLELGNDKGVLVKAIVKMIDADARAR